MAKTAKTPFDPETDGAAIRLSIETSRAAADTELGKPNGFTTAAWAKFPKEAKAILAEMIAAGSKVAKNKKTQMDAQRAASRKKQTAKAAASAPAKKVTAKKVQAKKAAAKKAGGAPVMVPQTPSVAPGESRTLIARIQQLEADVARIRQTLGV